MKKYIYFCVVAYNLCVCPSEEQLNEKSKKEYFFVPETPLSSPVRSDKLDRILEVMDSANTSFEFPVSRALSPVVSEGKIQSSEKALIFEMMPESVGLLQDSFYKQEIFVHDDVVTTVNFDSSAKNELDPILNRIKTIASLEKPQSSKLDLLLSLSMEREICCFIRDEHKTVTCAWKDFVRAEREVGHHIKSFMIPMRQKKSLRGDHFFENRDKDLMRNVQCPRTEK